MDRLVCGPELKRAAYVRDDASSIGWLPTLYKQRRQLQNMTTFLTRKKGSTMYMVESRSLVDLASSSSPDMNAFDPLRASIE